MQDNDLQLATSQKVEFLSQRTSYPNGQRPDFGDLSRGVGDYRPPQVKTIETHMSWVFLTEDYAYKLKKPVRTDFLDFSTLEARHRDCQAELRLNRRLAPNIYLDVVPLRVDATGKLHLEKAEAGRGEEVVDWLVKMRCLSADTMLDQAIALDTVRPKDLRPVGELLAQFYQNASPVSLSAPEYRHRIEADLQETLEALQTSDHHLSGEQIKAIKTRQLEILRSASDLFDRRVNEQRIIEGHGDLRPQHICLKPEPAIIDCLEFNRPLRILDPVDELAFLGLECERLGAAWIEEVIFAIYRDITRDEPPKALIQFYKTYRACLRAKLAVWHIQEPGRNGHHHWLKLARTYLQLGNQYLL